MSAGGDRGDTAPGAMGAASGSVRQRIATYLLGLFLASLLTVASFVVAGTHLVWQPAIPMALVTLAVAQIGVHLVFFLHLTSAPDNTNNILALAFGVFVVTLVVGGSFWIMGHLNANMLPMDELMRMQR